MKIVARRLAAMPKLAKAKFKGVIASQVDVKKLAADQSGGLLGKSKFLSSAVASLTRLMESASQE